MINVNQNYYPMEVWIWNHTQNKSGKSHYRLIQVKMRLSSACGLPTTPGHAPDEAADVLLRDLLPDLDLSISQLLDSLWCKVALVDGTRHDVPDVLDWIEVWGTGRPVQSIASMPSSCRNC